MTGRVGRSPAGLLLVVMLAAAMPAAGQDATSRALAERLERFEQTLRDLERYVYRGEPPPRSGAPAEPSASTARLADAEVRMTQLETELRRLTGQIEELDFRLRQVASRLDNLVADVDFRLKELEQRATAPVAAAGQPPPAPVGDGAPAAAPGQAAAALAAAEPVLPAGPPLEQYNFAFSLLRKSDFGQAERAFREFLEAHPDDRLAANAQYWLGETYYVRKLYDDAARVFLQGYRRAPDGAKAPDTLLKLGITLRRLGQEQEACATLAELLRRFPDADERLREKATRERGDANCR